jgi:hypothetical protein
MSETNHLVYTSSVLSSSSDEGRYQNNNDKIVLIKRNVGSFLFISSMLHYYSYAKKPA